MYLYPDSVAAPQEGDVQKHRQDLDGLQAESDKIAKSKETYRARVENVRPHGGFYNVVRVPGSMRTPCMGGHLRGYSCVQIHCTLFCLTSV